ncbi:MAG: hypothetical protein ACM3QU_11200 [Verrucomicrobiota bacterium]
MSPVAVGIGVAIVAAVVIWFMACIRTPEEEAQAILDEARSEAEAILAAAETKAADITAAAHAQTALAARDAELTTGEIIKKAEEKNWNLVAAAELQRTQARREAIRMQELANGVRFELAEMVSGLLAEVERTSRTLSANGHALPHGVRKPLSRTEPE